MWPVWPRQAWRALRCATAGQGLRPSAGASASLAPIPLRSQPPAGSISRRSWLTLPHLGSRRESCGWHALKEEIVAPGLIVDRNGYPSQLPADYYAGGALLPFGGHKGYGLGLMVEVLGGLLSGAGISSLPGYDGANGTMMIAIDTARFVPGDVLRNQMGAFAERISSSQPAAGYERVLLPGEPERIAEAQRSRDGIPIPETTWAELLHLRQSLTQGTDQ